MTIKVSFEGLRQAGGDITSSSNNITNRLDQLEGDLAPMTASWTGQAATFYQETQQKWDTAALELAEVLRQIGAAVNTAADTYAANEQRISSSWGR